MRLRPALRRGGAGHSAKAVSVPVVAGRRLVGFSLAPEPLGRMAARGLGLLTCRSSRRAVPEVGLVGDERELALDRVLGEGSPQLPAGLRARTAPGVAHPRGHLAERAALGSQPLGRPDLLCRRRREQGRRRRQKVRHRPFGTEGHVRRQPPVVAVLHRRHGEHAREREGRAPVGPERRHEQRRRDLLGGDAGDPREGGGLAGGGVLREARQKALCRGCPVGVARRVQGHHLIHRGCGEPCRAGRELLLPAGGRQPLLGGGAARPVAHRRAPPVPRGAPGLPRPLPASRRWLVGVARGRRLAPGKGLDRCLRALYLEEPRAALLGGPSRDCLGDEGPLRAVLAVEPHQRGVLGGRPRLPLDARVEMAPPTAHALLIGTSVAPAGNLRPSGAKLLDERLQQSVLLERPLVLADVGVHLMAPALRALLPGAPRDVLSDCRPLVAHLFLHVRKQFVFL
mmetsp:Transcript_38950/g.92241  ORF Transcript_38950/g.92241 Transcript_38950/m.92241 type:complete len:455 (+) Transcript_38950:487-1851(+)